MPNAFPARGRTRPATGPGAASASPAGAARLLSRLLYSGVGSLRPPGGFQRLGPGRLSAPRRLELAGRLQLPGRLAPRARRLRPGRVALSLEHAGSLLADGGSEELPLIDDALRRLAEANPRAALIVERRFFAGLTLDDPAASLGPAAPARFLPLLRPRRAPRGGRAASCCPARGRGERLFPGDAGLLDGVRHAIPREDPDLVVWAVERVLSALGR